MPKFPHKRQRLDPLQRRNLILDHAAKVVGSEGTLAANMARVAEEAGVSKPLIYTYFPNRIELLRALLEREYRRMQREQIQLTKLATSFEDFVRRTTHAYLKHCADRGSFIQLLVNEPALQETVAQAEAKDAGTVFFANQVRKYLEVKLDEEDLHTVTEICVGLSNAAGKRVNRAKSFDELVEITTTMIVAAVDASSDLLDGWKRKEIVNQ